MNSALDEKDKIWAATISEQSLTQFLQQYPNSGAHSRHKLSACKSGVF